MQKECLAYNVFKAVNDVAITVDTYQGDLDITSYYRDLSTNLVSDQVILQSEIGPRRQLILRS